MIFNKNGINNINKKKKNSKNNDDVTNKNSNKFYNKKYVNFRFQKNGLFPYIPKPKQLKYCVYSYK
jgi:hypothetical protein